MKHEIDPDGKKMLSGIWKFRLGWKYTMLHVLVSGLMYVAAIYFRSDCQSS